MDKSQLRILALRHARGEFTTEDFLARRKKLLDGLEAGEIFLTRRRDIPPRTIAGPVAQEPHPGPKTWWLPTALGAAVVVAIGVWISLSPRGESPSDDLSRETPPVSQPTTTRPLSVDATTRGRALTAQLLIEDDWSIDRIRRFAGQWLELPPNVREDALTAEWFQPVLARLAIRLNSPDEAGRAFASAQDLAMFWLSLRLSRPEIESPEGDHKRDVGLVATTPIDQSVAPTEPESLGTPGAGAMRLPTPGATEPGVVVAHQGGVNSRVAPLVRRSPRKSSLPPPQMESIERPGSQAEALENPPANEVASRQDETTLPDGVGSEETDLVELYTLQLFASSRSANARRLIERFPDLPLRLHEVSVPGSRYRVVYGLYPSAAAARAAAKALPARITDNTGPALIRALADLESLGR
ncbi:MAG: SPOR domain-containing protein [Pseudomonadota bacterium]